MDRVRYYFDIDSLDRRVIDALTAIGIDVVTGRDLGMQTATGAEHLDKATQLGRCLYTANVGDFARLHALRTVEGSPHAGIVSRSRQQTPVGDRIRALTKVHATLSNADMANRLEFLNSWL